MKIICSSSQFKTAMVTVALLFNLGCASTKTKDSQEPNFDHLINATLWQQRSGEMRALYFQGYQLGESLLQQKLKKKSSKPAAVIMDLDETVLDNSPYEAWVILHHAVFPRGWNEWVNLAQAKALPGSQDFLRLAEKKGVRIFYVSNRAESDRAATLKNLKALELPQATDENLLLAQPGSHSKEPHRIKIREKYNVLLLFGDNLNDFEAAYERQTPDKRQTLVDENRKKFGTEHIILPNSMYGDWEGAVVGYQHHLPQDEVRRSQLNSLLPY